MKSQKLLVVAILALTIATTGCSRITKSDTDTAVPISSGGAFPVQIDSSKTVKVDFTHESDRKKDASLEFVLIQSEVPISLGKISEGETSPQDDRLKPYDTAHDEQFSASTSGSGYSQIVRILRNNFRGQKIVMTPKSEPADVIFLQKTDPATVGTGVGFFDVFVQSGQTNVVDLPADRSYTYQLSLSDVLSDCSKIANSSNDPNEIAEMVQIGGQDAESFKANKIKKYPPDTLGPIDPSMIDTIKAANKGKEAFIDKVFDKNRMGNPYLGSFVKTTTLAQNHPGQGTEQLILSKTIFKPTPEQYLNDVDSIAMPILKANSDDNGSPTIQIVKGNQTTIYTPDIPAAVLNGQSAIPGTNIGISSTKPDASSSIQTDPWCGFTPESKPAIYLYPTLPTKVSVKLNPTGGYISASDPTYEKPGWQVLALPWGTIFSGLKSYPYLFYEAMLPAPQMPQNYAVVDGSSLYDDLSKLGGQLGLNAKESSEMADYWSAKLPAASYYQVGLMDKSEIDKIEPLDVSPKPQSILRIRLVFKAINQKLDVNFTPTSFTRHGFTLVEWGGFVLSTESPN